MAGGVGVKPLVKVPFVLFLAMFVHITVMASIHIDHVRPDVLLLVTIVSGLVCGSEQGAGIGFVLGVFADLTLQTPFGLSALVLTLVGFGVGTLQSLILRSSWWIPPATAVVASAIGVVLFATIGALIGQSQLLRPGPGHLIVVAGLVAVMNGIVAVPAAAAVKWATRTGQADRAFATR
jgi:rod shape-determining protein MreD